MGAIIEQLTVHTYLENEVMYPQVRQLVPEPADESLRAKTTILIENVTQDPGRDGRPRCQRGQQRCVRGRRTGSGLVEAGR